MIKYIFIFNEVKVIIKSNINVKLKEICNKFATNIGKNINDLQFLYNGNEINYELSFNQQTKENNQNLKKKYLFMKEIIK